MEQKSDQMDLRVIGENLPEDGARGQPQQPQTRGPPPPYAKGAEQRLPSVLVDSAFLFGIDPELEEILDNDPGLREMKARSFQPHLAGDAAQTAQGLPWHSLPEAGKLEMGFVANPNVVDRVRAHAIATRYN